MKSKVNPKRTEVMVILLVVLSVISTVGFAFLYMNNNTVQSEKDSSAGSCQTCSGQRKYQYSCSKPTMRGTKITSMTYCSNVNESGKVITSGKTRLGTVSCSGGTGCWDRKVNIGTFCTASEINKLSLTYTNVTCLPL